VTDRSTWESTAAWRELLDGMRNLDTHFLEGSRAVRDEQAVAEGYEFLATMLGVAFDVYLFSDSGRPRFADINTPFRADRRWGGDNTDAYYAYAPVDPARTYRVTGTRGDSAYFSITVYNEPSPGQWSDRVVGVVNDADLSFGPDGEFELYLGPERPAGWDGAFVQLAEDAAAAVTRDYQIDPSNGRRVEWSIEALEPTPDHGSSDAATARALRTVLRWIQENFAIVPIPIGERHDDERIGTGHNTPGAANQCAEPYRVPDANYGWSATDACYSFATYSLRPDEALVITHTPPSCRFWNVVVWNPFLAGFNADDARVSANIGDAVANADGSVTVVIAQESLDHPNAISTVGHSEGMLAFRWFHADVVPTTPRCTVVAASDAPRVLG